MSKEEELGLIRKAFLGYESHGYLTFVIEFTFGITQQIFGNYVVGVPDDKMDIHPKYLGMKAIMKILDAVGVNNWNDLVGKECWVRRDKFGVIEEIEAPMYRVHNGAFNIKELIKEIESNDKKN
jgi:hypothetical protein